MAAPMRQSCTDAAAPYRLVHAVMAAVRTARKTLQGFFAVYKAPGMSWATVRRTVQTKLMKELNSLKRPPPRQLVHFLPRPVEGSTGKELAMTVSQVPSLVDHPLVSGPVFSHLKIGVGSLLDKMSSGVLVLSTGYGNKLLPDIFKAHFIKTYTVRGLFGKATDDFSDMGKLIEKVTFDHITREQLERILCIIQGTHHKALLQCANVDLKTQEAYELAVRGLLRPMEKTPPLITGIRCLHFAPPEFQLEIHCLNETQQFLRKIVHEIGLELKSAAVCSHVRRIRDGVFTVDDALLRTQWDLHSIQEAILKSKHKLRTELQKTLAPPEVWEDFEEMDTDDTLQCEVETPLPENSSIK